MRKLNKQEIKKQFKKTRRDKEIVLVLENIQYARNVASAFRTADAAGVSRIVLTGISQTPPFGKDLQKASRKKEKSVPWEFEENPLLSLNKLKKQGFYLVAVELTNKGKVFHELPHLLRDEEKIVFVVGSEVNGVNQKSINKCDTSVFIPMYGKGASLNVGVSVGVVLYGV